MGVFYTSTDGLREVVEEVGPRRLEPVTADEPPVLVEPFLDPIVVEDSQGNGCFANTTCADESNWGEAFRKTDDILDQFVPPKTGPWRWGR